jgi:hypothetical protein
MKNALNGHKAWRDPGKLDRDWRTAGSLLAGTGVFGLLTRRIEADFQCLRGDDHARDMALDEVAVRKSGRRPTPASFSGWLISRVAPHAAAWIETCPNAPSVGAIPSPLTQGRGSKLLSAPHITVRSRRPSRRGVDRNLETQAKIEPPKWSPLTQGRGSKRPLVA